MAKSLFEIATHAEEIMIELDNIRNLLILYEDHFASETEGIDPEKVYTTAAFLARLPMLTSLFHAIEGGVSEAIQKLDALSSDALAAHKECKAASQ